MNTPHDDSEVNKTKRTILSTKGWTLNGLCALSRRMHPVKRISALAGPGKVGRMIKEYEEKGVPLVVGNWHKTKSWPKKSLLEVEWLLQHGGQSAFIIFLIFPVFC